MDGGSGGGQGAGKRKNACVNGGSGGGQGTVQRDAVERDVFVCINGTSGGGQDAGKRDGAWVDGGSGCGHSTRREAGAGVRELLVARLVAAAASHSAARPECPPPLQLTIMYSVLSFWIL